MFVYGIKYIKRNSLQIGFYSDAKPNDMMDLVSAVDTTDPLNVFTGNPELKTPRRYKSDLKFKVDRALSVHDISLNWEKVDKAVAMGYIYDRETGVKKGRMCNVDGNWKATVSYDAHTSFGRYRRFRLVNTLSGDYKCNVDLYGTAKEADVLSLPLRRVNSYTARDAFRIDWQSGQHRLSLFGDVRINRYTSNDWGFADFTSSVGNCGIAGVVNLPKDWSLSSDISLHMRRGFADCNLNTCDFIWNLRLSKSALMGKLMVIADCYDLLHQLSTVNYTVNAQARTETVSNVIPSYIMVHVRWNFNKSPKKK